MSLRCLTLVAVCVVFISTEAVLGEDVKKAVGDTVSFCPDKVNPSVSSITWKHKNSNGVFVKAIEWDFEDGFNIPNQRFKDITTLDEKTGQITITNLTVEHSGLYTLDINSEEQEQRFSLTVTGEEVKNVFGVVGGTVSFGPTSITPPVSSIIWKHKNSNGVVVRAIEWDVDDGVSTPSQRFQGITTLDKETGNITISKLNDEHSGLYTLNINSKEQEQRFKLEIMSPVPKPEMKIEKIQINPDAVYLICEYRETIVWKNSAGGTLKGSPHSPEGEVLTVEKTGNPDVFYTCTLKNEVSEETSDPVYEKDLFEG